MLLENPYRTGNPVGEDAAFIGRQDVLREVVRVLRQPGQNALTLFGQRRIGKTSVLQYLAAHLPDEGQYCPVYFDLQDKAQWPLERLLRELARTIAHALAQPAPDLGDDPRQAFRQTWLPALLADALPAGHSLVLLFDEFDVLADPGGGKAISDFFPYLRELLTLDPARLQFVFVLGRNIGDLANIALSVFKGIPNKRVSLLSQKDTFQLARLSQANGTLQWPDQAARRVWELTSGHPFLTQALCSQVWEIAHENAEDEPSPVSVEMVEDAVPDALDAARNTLEWLWDGLGPAERVVSAALAQAGPRVVSEGDLEHILREAGVRIVIRELQNAPQLLQDWDILEAVDGGYRFRVELLRRWIADYRPLNRVQDELDRIQPLAENLYQAAHGMYRSGDIQGAEDLLRRAIGVNPNHIRANLLLAEILIGNARLDEARTLLETWHEFVPGEARPRLIQVYLQQAEAAAEADAQLELYEAVLRLDPQHPEALRGKRAVWQAHASAALKQEDFQAAEAAFNQAGMPEQAAEVARVQKRREVRRLKHKVEGLKNDQDFDAAYELAQKIAQDYPDAEDWDPLLARLEEKKRLNGLYQQALGALKQQQYADAQQFFAEVVRIQPDYKDAARYLQQGVVGDDRERAREASPPRFTIPSPKSLSVWNPLDYFRLLWWILITPDKLLTHRDAFGRFAEHSIGNRLAFTLAGLPLLTPVLGLGLDLMPRTTNVWDAFPYLWIAAGIGSLWGLYELLVQRGGSPSPDRTAV